MAPDYTPRAEERLTALPPEDRGAQSLALAVVSARGGRPLDLLPVPLRPRRLTRAQAVTVATAGVTALLLLTALLVPSFRDRRQLARLDAEITRLDPDVRAVDRVLRELERKRKLLATINGIEANAMRPLPALRELTELVPNDTWLTTLTLDQKGVELTGQAAAASALIPLLENSPLLERVEFSSPVTRGRDREQFRIRAAWEPGGQARAATVSAAPTSPPMVTPPPAAAVPAPAAPPPAPGAAGPPRRPPVSAPAVPAPIQPAPPRTGGQP
jgi:Tfp pilus assembly protein PilN